ncbi:hypothetical protein AHAS_Ahas09G0215100 [Arachis hypogaea]
MSLNASCQIHATFHRVITGNFQTLIPIEVCLDVDPGDNTVQERYPPINDVDPDMNLELTMDVPHPEQVKQRNATSEHDAAEMDVVARIFLHEKGCNEKLAGIESRLAITLTCLL